MPASIMFAEGQIVVLDGEQVIGQGSGFFTDFDFENPQHQFSQFCDAFYFRNHSIRGASLRCRTSVFTQPTAGASES